MQLFKSVLTKINSCFIVEVCFERSETEDYNIEDLIIPRDDEKIPLTLVSEEYISELLQEWKVLNSPMEQKLSV